MQTGDGACNDLRALLDHPQLHLVSAGWCRRHRARASEGLSDFVAGSGGPLRVSDAVGNGSADDPAPLQSAEEWSRTTAGASMVWLDAGSYRLKGTVYNPSGSLWLVPPGASVSGGLLEGNTDGSAISPHHEGLALISNATTAGGSALFVSRNFSKPSPFGAYESDGLYISVADLRSLKSCLSRHGGWPFCRPNLRWK